MALKVRVLALPSPIKGTPVSSILFRAEAYEENDAFRDPKWTCPHSHVSAQDAHTCGMDWLAEQADTEGEANPTQEEATP
ncbi:MAG TPA: hypothetical protein VGG90_11460 [Candidatus Dormibacteraeota bacterium]|jgi:hypothetical protein